MGRKLGLSTSFFGRRIPLPEEWEGLRKAGFDYAEVALLETGRSMEEWKEAVASYVNGAKSAGLELWTLHLPYGWETDVTMEGIKGAVDDSAGEDGKSASWVRILKPLIDQGCELGFRVFVLHASFEPIPDGEREQRLQNGNKNIRKLAEYVNHLGCELAIECLPRTCIGNSGEECMRLVENTTAKICMDINHLFHEKPKEFIEKLGEKIITTHISDNDGVDERHLIPGRGIIDFPEAIRALDKVNPDIPFTFEIRNAPGITPGVIMQEFRNIIANTHEMRSR